MPREKEDLVDLTENPGRFQLALQAWFFKSEIFAHRRFDEALHEDALYRMMIGILRDYPKFYHIRYLFYYYTSALEDNASANPFQYQLWWYQAVGGWITSVLQQEEQDKPGHTDGFVQRACWYLIYMRFYCNMNDRNKGVLHSLDEVKAFAEKAYIAINSINNDVILRRSITSYTNADRVIRMQMLRGKAAVSGCDSYVTQENGHFVMRVRSKENEKSTAWQSDYAVLQRCDNEKLRVRIINYEAGNIIIEANFAVSDYLEREQFSMYAVSHSEAQAEGTVIPAEDLPDYPLVKCFEYTFRRKFPFRFVIPVTGDEQQITFFYKFEDQEYQVQLDFKAVGARICSWIPHAYWMFRPHGCLMCEDEKTIVLRKTDKARERELENEFEQALMSLEQDEEKARLGIALRREYWKKKKAFFRKPIWITFDKLYKAGDNGEYMYQHIRKHHKEVDIYYIIKEDSPDYERLTEQDKKHILVYGTMRCRLICALADIVLATHADVTAKYDAQGEYREYLKDLYRGEVVCIQHGLTTQKIAQYQNRQFDNTKLYCCASPYELQNMSSSVYGYQKDQIKLTGLARYDGLVNRDKHIILITPSWRRSLVSAGKANSQRLYNENFKNSIFFHTYNQLINDQRLISTAKQEGYHIVFLLHPEICPQLEDFDQNNAVTILPATGNVSYEQLLCEASLMVTDYSGVQFDFAYMKKPVIYYQTKDIPPQYDDGRMDYQTMGFGPICRDYNELVHIICNYIENGCKLDEEYISRVERFFKFFDNDNSERIYQETKKYFK